MLIYAQNNDSSAIDTSLWPYKIKLSYNVNNNTLPNGKYEPEAKYFQAHKSSQNCNIITPLDA
jgi:hypothetical protein